MRQPKQLEKMASSGFGFGFSAALPAVGSAIFICSTTTAAGAFSVAGDSADFCGSGLEDFSTGEAGVVGGVAGVTAAAAVVVGVVGGVAASAGLLLLELSLMLMAVINLEELAPKLT